MLILSRKPGDGLKIGEEIEIRFLSCERGQIRIAIIAPTTVNVVRTELLKRIVPVANDEADS